MTLIHSGPSLRFVAVALFCLSAGSLTQAQEQPAAQPVQASPTAADNAQSVAPQAPAMPSAPVEPAPSQAPGAAPVAAPDAATVATGVAPSAPEPAAMDVGSGAGGAVQPAPAPAATGTGTGTDAGAEADAALHHDLSPEGMFMAADWVVKSVMLSLAFASLVTWTVWVAKSLQLFGAKMRAKKALKAIVQSRHLADALAVLGTRPGVVATMVRAAQHEMQSSDGAIDLAGGEGVKERVASALGRIEARAGRQMSKGTGVLASIGSTAPFVGLFGTVWGIMNSFIGIAETQTTNLAVVAPGIAEALLATAIGLVAAIPAVIIYNVFARSVTGYRQLLADAAAGIERLVSRDLDYRRSALVAARDKDLRHAAE